MLHVIDSEGSPLIPEWRHAEHLLPKQAQQATQAGSAGSQALIAVLSISPAVTHRGAALSSHPEMRLHLACPSQASTCPLSKAVRRLFAKMMHYTVKWQMPLDASAKRTKL